MTARDTGLVGIRLAREEELASHQEAGRLWVVSDADDRPAKFLVADLVDGCLHLRQVSADPGSTRRGLGRAMLDFAAEQAAAGAQPAMTLTTSADVPWNAPCYLRCGFRVLDEAEVSAGLRAIRQREAAAGLDRW